VPQISEVRTIKEDFAHNRRRTRRRRTKKSLTTGTSFEALGDVPFGTLKGKFRPAAAWGCDGWPQFFFKEVIQHDYSNPTPEPCPPQSDHLPTGWVTGTSGHFLLFQYLSPAVAQRPPGSFWGQGASSSTTLDQAVCSSVGPPRCRTAKRSSTLDATRRASSETSGRG
jgi:hypothetical protein